MSPVADTSPVLTPDRIEQINLRVDRSSYAPFLTIGVFFFSLWVLKQIWWIRQRDRLYRGINLCSADLEAG